MSDIPELDLIEGFPHPRECETLIGHKSVEDQFMDSFNSGRFHHAWLLTGPKGVGKASFAYKAAKFLLTAEEGGGLFGPPENMDVSADHPAISLIHAGSHPGLTVLKCKYDEKGKKFFKNIRVDDVRTLSDFFGMTSTDGGWRVVIVDTADDMNVNSANAILKILEEPPAKTIFFLISHSPAKLLQTIRSRCRTLSFNALQDEQLEHVVAPFMTNLEPQEMKALIALSEGSPGKAASLYSAGGIDAFLGILDIFDQFPNYNADKLHGLADLAAKKDNNALYQSLCELIPWWLSRLVRSSSTGYTDSTLLDQEKEIMSRLISRKPVPFWIEMWEKSNSVIERAEAINLDKKQVILNLFLSPTLNN